MSLGWTNSPLRARGEASAATCCGAEVRRHSDLRRAGYRGDRTSQGRGQRGPGGLEKFFSFLEGGLNPSPLCPSSDCRVWEDPSSQVASQPHAASVTRAPSLPKPSFSDSSEQQLGQEQEASTTFLFTLLTATEPASDPAE